MRLTAHSVRVPLIWTKALPVDRKMALRVHFPPDGSVKVCVVYVQ